MQTRKIVAVGASALVLVVAVVGLFLAGSPASERRRQLDVQRVNALQNIASAVDQSYASDQALPASLEALRARAANKNDVYLGATVDPVTGADYEYRPLDGTSYELCATFDADVPAEYDAQGGMKPRGVTPAIAPYPGQRDWTHGAGHVCFTLDASWLAPTVACSLTNPCVAPNTTCAQLPGKGTFCVPQGKECLAAGCDAAYCTVAESYPVQVRCDAPKDIDMPDQPAPAQPRPITCNLMKSSVSGEMACFGCGSQICNKPGPQWEHYEQSGDIGIPYSCFDDENGKCALAQ